MTKHLGYMVMPNDNMPLGNICLQVPIRLKAAAAVHSALQSWRVGFTQGDRRLRQLPRKFTAAAVSQTLIRVTTTSPCSGLSF